MKISKIDGVSAWLVWAPTGKKLADSTPAFRTGSLFRVYFPFFQHTWDFISVHGFYHFSLSF